MRREWLAVTAVGSATFIVGWSAAAMAAPTATYDWSGTYFGAALGLNSGSPTTFNYPHGSEDITFTDNTPYFPFETVSGQWPAFPSSMDAFGGGPAAYVGANWQAGNNVYGWEGDLSFLGTGLTQNVGGYTGTDFRSGTFTTSGGLNALFTFRPRLGIAVDKLLLYGTGGLAVGQASLTTSAGIGQSGDAGKGSADWSGSTTAWKTGYVLGGGGEYALNKRMSVRFEALYYNLGSISTTAAGSGSTGISPETPATATSYTATMPLAGTIARVGLTFHLQ